jgi:hypothetical protein
MPDGRVDDRYPHTIFFFSASAEAGSVFELPLAKQARGFVITGLICTSQL